MTMKNKLLHFGLLWLTFQFFNQSVFAQNPTVPSGTTGDQTQNIALTTITFDDIIFSADNSIPISPNRYAGVSFTPTPMARRLG